MTASRIGCYARYSSSHQNEQTIDCQLEHCHKYAGEPTVDYVDKAITGKTVARAALVQMMEDAAAGKLDRVIVYKWDRLGRSASTHVLVAELEELGVKLESVTEGSEFLGRELGLVVATHYSKQLGQRVRDAQRKLWVDKGIWCGGTPPYGYKLVDGHLQIDKAEASVLRWIFKTYLSESCGYRELAIRLNKRHSKPRTGKLWSYFSIVKILDRGPLYAGTVTYGKFSHVINRKTGKRTRRANTDALVRHDESLRLISDEELAQLTARKKQRALVQPRPAGQIRALTGLITCACCSGLVYGRGSSMHGRKITYLICGTRYRHGPDSCDNAVSVSEKKLVQKISDTMMAVFDNDTEEIMADVLNGAAKELERDKGEVARIKGRLADAQKQVDAFTKLMLDGDVQADANARKSIVRQLGEAETQRDQLRDLLAQQGDKQIINMENMTKAVRKALDEAKANLAGIQAPAQFNQMAQVYPGPMLLQRDGTVTSVDEPDTDAITYTVTRQRTSEPSTTRRRRKSASSHHRP